MTRRQDAPPVVCRRCGGPKQDGRGRKLCDGCVEPAAREANKGQSKRKNEAHKAERAAAGRSRKLRMESAPEGTAWCSKCQTYQPLDAFPPNASRPSGLNAYCRPCYRLVLHERRLRQEFDMTVAEYDALLEAQDGRCAICMARPVTRRLAVDHNHKTGEIRGLLCTRCNHKLLGAGQENPNILRRAAEYLEQTLLRPVEEAPSSNFGRDVMQFFDDRLATLAGFETEFKARATTGDVEGWIMDLQREAMRSGRHRWALFVRRPGKSVREALVLIPVWVMADLLSDERVAADDRAAS